MYSSNFSKQFKLNFHLQLFSFYAVRVANQQWRSKREEEFVINQLAHHKSRATALMNANHSSTENILNNNGQVAFVPAMQTA